MIKYLKDFHTEEGHNLFFIIPVYRIHKNVLKLQEKYQEKLLRAVPQWNQLPWEVVSAPVLEALQRKLENNMSDIF